MPSIFPLLLSIHHVYCSHDPLHPPALQRMEQRLLELGATEGTTHVGMLVSPRTQEPRTQVNRGGSETCRNLREQIALVCNRSKSKAPDN